MTEPEQGPDAADLRKAYHALQEKGSDGCPPPETLAALATGELAGEERERTADHVVRCRNCGEAAQILLRTHAEAGARPRPGRSRLAGLAAAIAVAALAGVLIWRSPRRDEVVRGGTQAESVAPADHASLGEAPREFRWPARPQAEGYRVKLFASNGDGLWDADAGTGDRIALPEAARSRLAAGQSYFWIVEVRMPLETQRLGPYTFTMRP
jgi:hypothetical protein